MASQHEIGLAYDWMDGFYPKIFGPNADISCAFYNGEYTKTLAQAQRDKHEWILKGLAFKPGQRILDIGSGWGNMLQAVAREGGIGVGLTLSAAQAEACRKRGLDARLQDWKTVQVEELGSFDGIVSIGAFEHFCSIVEYERGKQDSIYQALFSFCSKLLPSGGVLYLQSMTWGDRIPDPNSGIDLKAPEGSDERILGRLRIFYPGSWLPSGKEQILAAAHPSFRLTESNNGRQDYIQTLSEWRRGILRWARNPIHWPSLMLTLLKHTLRHRQFLQRPLSILREDQREVFVRRLFNHERMFFRRT